jgi:hypothetical protein
MQEEFIPLIQHAIKFANIGGPDPETGISRLNIIVEDANTKLFAVAVLNALSNVGLRIVRDSSREQ